MKIRAFNLISGLVCKADDGTLWVACDTLRDSDKEVTYVTWQGFGHQATNCPINYTLDFCDKVRVVGVSANPLDWHETDKGRESAEERLNERIAFLLSDNGNI